MAASTTVGVWGVGRHAQRRLLPAIAECADLQLAAVCTRDAAAGRQASQRWGCTYFDQPETLLSQSQLDAVLLATPTGLHFEHGCRVLRAQKHLWCEKPLTETRETTRRIFELARAEKRSVQVAMMYKYHPQFTALKRLLDERVVGEPVSLSFKFGMPALATETFRQDPALGGGALLDVSCYPLSAAVQLLGTELRLHAAAVSTQTGSRTDTDGWAVLTAGGVRVDLEWGMGRAYVNELVVWGTDGSLRCDRIFSKEPNFGSQILRYDRRGALTQTLETGAANAYVEMLRHFAQHCAATGPEQGAEQREAEWCAAMVDQIRAAGRT